jgi:hypothetical protein
VQGDLCRIDSIPPRQPGTLTPLQQGDQRTDRMNSNIKNIKRIDLVNTTVDTKVVLAGLWVSQMILYAYCDILSIYRTGQIENILRGKMGFLDVTQQSLVVASILMIIPALMISLSLVLKAKINKIVNIVVGVAYLMVDIGNVVCETWAYYYAFGTAEILIIVVILYRAVRWPNSVTLI